MEIPQPTVVSRYGRDRLEVRFTSAILRLHLSFCTTDILSVEIPQPAVVSRHGRDRLEVCFTGGDFSFTSVFLYDGHPVRRNSSTGRCVELRSPLEVSVLPTSVDAERRGKTQNFITGAAHFCAGVCYSNQQQSRAKLCFLQTDVDKSETSSPWR